MPSGFLNTVVTERRNLAQEMYSLFCSENAYFSKTRPQASLCIEM